MMQDEAEKRYEMVERENQQEEANGHSHGYKPYLTKLHKGGPLSKVWWCFPVLPGVLLADSQYSVGPLYAEGGVKIVFYYGVGSVAVPTPFGWIT